MQNAIAGPYRNWGSLMRANDETYGEKPWLIYYAEDGSRSNWSYAVFIDVSRRLAQLLQVSGVRRGSRVVIASHNHPDTIISYFACWLLGACAVPLNMTEDDQRLAYIIANCDASLVLCRSCYLDRISSAMKGAPLPVIEMDSDEADPAFYANIRACEPLAYPSDSAEMLDAECLLVYTSGTTGNPKGVVLVQKNLFADGQDITDWHALTPDQRMMCVLPVHHVNGTIVTHVTPFIAGASVVLHRKFSPRTFFSTVIAEKVNVISVVPTLLAFLLESKADATGAREAGLRHIICGAGPLTCELADRFESAYDIRVLHGYGLSETTCYSCFLPIDLSDVEHRQWMQDHGFPSIGVAIPCNEMAIHDAAGQDVPDGERGEIVIRGRNVMRGYDKNDKANAEAFAFGWFRSGDEGFRIADERGRHFYFITGRLKELIIRGGVNLAPLEIDEVINRAPGVKAGICVGFENNMYGEEVGALIIPTSETVTEDDVLSFCAEHLPVSKRPKVVVFTDALPVTSTGKYQRNSVKHLFAAWKDAQFR
ncbi:MAG: class I adenylate-forming enzyme family protein [Candidatus Kapaibacterium sp.]